MVKNSAIQFSIFSALRIWPTSPVRLRKVKRKKLRCHLINLVLKNNQLNIKGRLLLWPWGSTVRGAGARGGQCARILMSASEKKNSYQTLKFNGELGNSIVFCLAHTISLQTHNFLIPNLEGA